MSLMWGGGGGKLELQAQPLYPTLAFSEEQAVKIVDSLARQHQQALVIVSPTSFWKVTEDTTEYVRGQLVPFWLIYRAAWNYMMRIRDSLIHKNRVVADTIIVWSVCAIEMHMRASYRQVKLICPDSITSLWHTCSEVQNRSIIVFSDTILLRPDTRTWFPELFLIDHHLYVTDYKYVMNDTITIIHYTLHRNKLMRSETLYLPCTNPTCRVVAITYIDSSLTIWIARRASKSLTGIVFGSSTNTLKKINLVLPDSPKYVIRVLGQMNDTIYVLVDSTVFLFEKQQGRLVDHFTIPSTPSIFSFLYVRGKSLFALCRKCSPHRRLWVLDPYLPRIYLYPAKDTLILPEPVPRYLPPAFSFSHVEKGLLCQGKADLQEWTGVDNFTLFPLSDSVFVVAGKYLWQTCPQIAPPGIWHSMVLFYHTSTSSAAVRRRYFLPQATPSQMYLLPDHMGIRLIAIRPYPRGYTLMLSKLSWY